MTFKIKHALQFPDDTIQTTAAVTGSWSKKTANYTATVGEKIVCDTTSGTFTLTLPASPATGHAVVLADSGDWATNNLTVARNGNSIEGLAEDLTLNIKGIQVEFVYDGTTWEVFTNAAPQGSGISNDITTNSSFYPLFAAATSGSLTTCYTANTKLYFNPSTGTVNATDFNSLSDKRFKKEITPISGAVDIVSQIEGVEFLWEESDKKSSGVIAQQLETILPHLVGTNSVGVKSVNYDGLIGYLIQAVKELSMEIETLKGTK